MKDFSDFKWIQGSVLAILFANATATFTGCERHDHIRKDILIDKIVLQRDTRIEFVQDVNNGSDWYRMDVYDQEDNLRASFRTYNIQDGTYLMHEDGTSYTVENGKRFLKREQD